MSKHIEVDEEVHASVAHFANWTETLGDAIERAIEQAEEAEDDG